MCKMQGGTWGKSDSASQVTTFIAQTNTLMNLYVLVYLITHGLVNWISVPYERDLQQTKD